MRKSSSWSFNKPHMDQSGVKRGSRCFHREILTKRPVISNLVTP